MGKSTLHQRYTKAMWDAACAAGLKPGRRKIPQCIWRPLFESQGHRCAHCNRYGRLEVDHIHPLGLGGGNESSNLQALCAYCNSRKGARRIG
jgi:5-methylcytosine-specific restriction endonuclease McrA